MFREVGLLSTSQMELGLLPRDAGLGWSEWGILLSLLEGRKE